MTLSTDLLPAINIETGNHPIHTVLWLHGLGADGNDFVPIVKQLNLPPEIPIRFVFPHAPMRPVSINNGLVMRAWYDIYDTNFEGHEDETGIKASQLLISNLIKQEIKQGIKVENIILAGFSQGGAVALQTGLHHQVGNLAGIIALSCYLPLAKAWAIDAHQYNSMIPILMLHGTHDPIISVSLAETSRDVLLGAGCKVEWHEYNMEHNVCNDEILLMGEWIKRIIKGTGV